MTIPEPERKPKADKTVLYIVLGTMGCLGISMVALVSLGILGAIAIPKLGQSEATVLGAEAHNTLTQLQAAAGVYESAHQDTQFVSPEPAPNNADITMELSGIGDQGGPPCQIGDKKITCSGGSPGTRFPGLPGPVTFHFNDGPEHFTVHCATGPTAPKDWDAARCNFHVHSPPHKGAPQ
jgi:hypothetical protein